MSLLVAPVTLLAARHWSGRFNYPQADFWGAVSFDDVRADPREVDQQLVPLLRAAEMQFLDHLNDRGDIVPELLTVDPEMQRLLRGHNGGGETDAN